MSDDILSREEHDKLVHFLTLALNNGLIQAATRFTNESLNDLAAICRKIERAATFYHARRLVLKGDHYIWSNSVRLLDRAELENKQRVKLPLVYKDHGQTFQTEVLAYEIEGDYYL